MGMRQCQPGVATGKEWAQPSQMETRAGREGPALLWVLEGAQLWPSPPLSARGWHRNGDEKWSKGVRKERQWERRHENLGGRGNPQMSVLHRWRISQFLIKILYVVGCKPNLAFWNTDVCYKFRVWLTPDRYRSTLILLLSAAVANGKQSGPARQVKRLLIDGNQPNPISCLSAILTCLFMANLGTGWAAGCSNCGEADGVESVAGHIPFLSRWKICF